MIRCKFVNSSCFHRQHHPGPTMFLFCSRSHVSLRYFLFKIDHMNILDFVGHLNFQTNFHHQTWKFSLPSPAKAMYPILGTYSPARFNDQTIRSSSSLSLTKQDFNLSVYLCQVIASSSLKPISLQESQFCYHIGVLSQLAMCLEV